PHWHAIGLAAPRRPSWRRMWWWLHRPGNGPRTGTGSGARTHLYRAALRAHRTGRSIGPMVAPRPPPSPSPARPAGAVAPETRRPDGSPGWGGIDEPLPLPDARTLDPETPAEGSDRATPSGGAGRPAAPDIPCDTADTCRDGLSRARHPGRR